MTTTPLDPAVTTILREAAAWRLLGRLFECPSAAWQRDVAALAAEVGDADLERAAAAALEEASEGIYHSMLGPGGPAPPREVSYRDSVELGSVMSSVTGYYRAFGYRPSLMESPDHVAVETGFMAFLRTKQAFAMSADDTDGVEVTVEAAEAFRIDHLAVIAERLAGLLEDAPVTYLQLASKTLVTRVGPRPGPKMLPVIQPPDDDDGSTFECLA